MARVKAYELFTYPLINKGAIPFGYSDDQTDVLTNDPTRLYWDDTNHYLGINTAVPTAVLNVEGTVIFNDAGADYDFRVEGDTDANLFFLDASTDQIGIGTNAPGAKLDVRGSAIFNEAGAAVDFRVESDTQTHALFVDGSANRVGINQSTLTHQLDVNGDLACTYLYGQTQSQVADDTLFLGDTTNANFFIDKNKAGAAMIFGYNTPRIVGSTPNGVVQIYNNSTNRELLFHCAARGSTGGQNAVVVNNGGVDVDFVVNGNTVNNCLLVDAANDQVQMAYMSSAGFVKNSVSGVLSGGNSVDISDDTNLAVTSPIVLTDDTLSLDQGSVDHGSLGGLTDDDHTQYILHSLADAANDFLVASGDNTFVKKTLAETGAILEADIDHDNLQGFVANEHIDWTSSPASKTISLADDQDYAFSSGAKIERSGGDIKLTPESGKDVLLVMRTKARAYRSGTQAITTGTDTPVQLNAESYDIGSDFDSATNYRFNVPVTGYYLIAGAVYLSALGSDKFMYCSLRVDGSTVTYGNVMFNSGAATGDMVSNVSDILALTSGQYIQLYIYHNHGADRNIAGAANQSFLAVHLLSVDS